MGVLFQLGVGEIKRIDGSGWARLGEPPLAIEVGNNGNLDWKKTVEMAFCGNWLERKNWDGNIVTVSWG